MIEKSSGTWCSGITSASHAEGPGFNPQCVHLRYTLANFAVHLHYTLVNFALRKVTQVVLFSLVQLRACRPPGLQRPAGPHRPEQASRKRPRGRSSSEQARSGEKSCEDACGMSSASAGAERRSRSQARSGEKSPQDAGKEPRESAGAEDVVGKPRGGASRSNPKVPPKKNLAEQQSRRGRRNEAVGAAKASDIGVGRRAASIGCLEQWLRRRSFGKCVVRSSDLDYSSLQLPKKLGNLPLVLTHTTHIRHLIRRKIQDPSAELGNLPLVSQSTTPTSIPQRRPQCVALRPNI